MTDRPNPIVHADELPYDNSTSGLSAEDVQSAIDELHGGTPVEHGNALFPDSTISATKDAANPTFAFAAIPESIVKVGDTYWCVYQGNWGSGSPADVRLAYASDRDGPWTEYASNPILTAGSQAWEVGGLNAPEIVEVDGTFYLFYAVTSSSTGIGKIGLATAPKVTGPYTKSVSNPVLEPSSTAADWDSLRVDEPSVIHHDGRWVMAFMAETSTEAYQESEQIGIATADDPEGPWTKSPANPVVPFGDPGDWDDLLTADPYLFFANGYYWIWYSGGGGEGGGGSGAYYSLPWQCGLASALDPVAGPWTKHPDSPILPNGGAGAFDEEAAWRGSLFVEDGLWSGVYGGLNSGLGTVRGGSFRLTVTAPSGGGASLSDADPADVGTTSAGVSTDASRADHVHALPTTTRVWMPLTTVVGGVPELVWDADDSLIPTEVPT